MDSVKLAEFDSEIVLLGDKTFQVNGLSPSHAPLDNTLIIIKNKKYWTEFLTKHSSLHSFGLLLDKNLYDEIKDATSFARVIFLSHSVEKSMVLFSKVFYDFKYHLFNYLLDSRKNGSSFIDPSCEIAPNVFIGSKCHLEKNVKIHANVVLMGNVHIKEGTILYPNTTIYPFVEIGQQCRIHSGAVIGADGFGYFFHQGEHQKIWHYGGVKIGNDVEIGANSCVDSGTFTPTLIGDGTKIDNLVQVAHNVKIGKKVIVCGGSSLAGSCILEDYVVLGGEAGIGPGVTLGLGSQVAGASKVHKSWPAKSKIGGYPAVDLKEWLTSLAFIKKSSKK